MTQYMINIQKNNKIELDDLLLQLSFLKTVLIDMSNNLQNLNKMKLYDTSPNRYNTLYYELKYIKDKFDLIDTEDQDFNKLSRSIYDFKVLLLQYINHIAPSLESIIILIFGNEWYDEFKPNEVDKIKLLIQVFNPINVWDSSYHLIPLKYRDIPTPRIPISKDSINSMIDSTDKLSFIVGNKNSFTSFVKNITDIIKEFKPVKVERKKDFNYQELNSLFISSNIVLYKNTISNSFAEEKLGFNILIKSNTRIILIQGLVKDDLLELYKSNKVIKDRLNEINIYMKTQVINIPKQFKMNYINCMNIRDILVNKNEDIHNIIKKYHNDYTQLINKTLGCLINDFLLASKFRKYEILVILLSNDTKVGFLLFDILKLKDKSGISSELYNSLHSSLKIKLDNIEKLINEEDELISIEDISYERRINIMNISNQLKYKAFDKLKAFKNNSQGDNKAQSWLDGFLKIPFGVYRENQIMTFKNTFIEEIKNKYNKDVFSLNEINQFVNHMNDINMKLEWENYKLNKSKYLNNVSRILNESVYGHKEAKKQLERLFAQWINGQTKGAIIGLCGPPGTGKTSLAKNGLSKCLIDNDNKPRPFVFLPIGGSVNGSTLVGHNYTYLGSTWGRIVDILITSECMNPIIFIDEVDKVSNTEYGKEIISILTHLTDATQNDNFEDKYFAGIPLDLSKALIVFSFNDISVIDPILKDRITVIETKAYTLQEKIHIIKNYMIPEILKDVGFSKDEIVFSDSIITFIIERYTHEAGVRKIKEKLVDIIRDINLTNTCESYIPFIVTIEYIEQLFKNINYIRTTSCHSQPEVGLVNGLYATNSGIGGLTAIQVVKYPSEKMMDITITGQQGEVMKESVEYAMKIAYSLLSDEGKEKILEDSKNKKNFGLLIHAPDAGTKKDGPSAGAAITLAIYSVLTNKKIDNTMALTGEIDLWKNIKEIGGVYAKLTGAKKAGVKTVLIPRENLRDLEILREDGSSPEDENFKVITVDTIYDIIDLMINTIPKRNNETFFPF
jgi:ATP-dependent Lon protease